MPRKDNTDIRIAQLQKQFPHLNDSQAKAIAKNKGGLLTEERREEFLDIYAKGHAISECIKLAGISKGTMNNTRKCYPDFDKAIRKIDANRKYQVESSLIRYCLGKMETIKTTMQAVFNKDGTPVKDVKGNQTFVIVKKEVTVMPANPYLIQMFLKARWPERYGDASRKGQMDVFIGVDDLKDTLQKKLQMLPENSLPPPDTPQVGDFIALPTPLEDEQRESTAVD